MALDKGGIEEKPPEKRPSFFQLVNSKIQKKDENFRKKLAESILSKKFLWTILTLVLWTILVALALIFFRLLEYKVRLGTISEVTGRFITSPGAAGLAALLAAIIGARMISKQLKLARATAHESEWWSKFEWVTERALPSVNDHVSIPGHVAVNFLNQLQKSAQSDIQQEACGGFVDHLAALVVVTESKRSEPGDEVASVSGGSVSGEPAPGEPVPRGSVPRGSVPRGSAPRKVERFSLHAVENTDRALAAWVAYAKDTKNTPASSIEAMSIAQGMIDDQMNRNKYERQALKALSSVSGVTLLEETKNRGNDLPRAYLQYGGCRVAVVIHHSASAEKHSSKLKRSESTRRMLSLDKLHLDADRVLFISNDGSEPIIRPSLGKKSEFVEWWPEDMADVRQVDLKSALTKLTS